MCEALRYSSANRRICLTDADSPGYSFIFDAVRGGAPLKTIWRTLAESLVPTSGSPAIGDPKSLASEPLRWTIHLPKFPTRCTCGRRRPRWRAGRRPSSSGIRKAPRTYNSPRSSRRSLRCSRLQPSRAKVTGDSAGPVKRAGHGWASPGCRAQLFSRLGRHSPHRVECCVAARGLTRRAFLTGDGLQRRDRNRPSRSAELT
jgi:hypothetical protein